MKDEHTADRFGETIITYKLRSYEDIPFSRTIMLGGVEIPRLLDTDKGRAEDINVMVEALAQYAASLEERFQRLMRKETESDRATIIYYAVRGIRGPICLDPDFY